MFLERRLFLRKDGLGVGVLFVFDFVLETVLFALRGVKNRNLLSSIDFALESELFLVDLLRLFMMWTETILTETILVD